MNDASVCICVCTVQGCMSVCVCTVQGCVYICVCTVQGVCTVLVYSVGVCVHSAGVCTVQVFVWMSVFVHACGGHRSTLVSSFPVLSFPFWDSASLNLELTSLSKWAGQPVPRALLSLHDQHWNHSSTMLHPDFTWVLGIQTRTRSSCSKHFPN